MQYDTTNKDFRFHYYIEICKRNSLNIINVEITPEINSIKPCCHNYCCKSIMVTFFNKKTNEIYNSFNNIYNKNTITVSYSMDLSDDISEKNTDIVISTLWRLGEENIDEILRTTLFF